jgi:ferredoxin
MPKIKFLKSDLTLEAPSGSDLIKICLKHPTQPIKFGCTRGDCGVCAISIVEGCEHLTQCSPKEKQTLKQKGHSDGYRLACQCAFNGDITIDK